MNLIISHNNSGSYYSHSENSKGVKHLLKDHLNNTARIAESFGRNDVEKSIMKISGLLHDLGKYQEEFQKYLIEGGRRGSVTHAVHGAQLARINNLQDISIAINGHHKGIPEVGDWKADTSGSEDEIKAIKAAFFRDLGFSEESFFIQMKSYSDPYEKELFIRYIFSALTDADWLDTESHFSPEKTELRQSRSLDIQNMINKLEAHFDKMPETGDINKMRNNARNEAGKKADLPYGFFSLNLPTGLGKTLTSVYWALLHAKANSLRRIIIVLPYINIIDQTAEILKSIFGNENILEHHSNVNEDYYKNDESFYDIQKLASENWDYPFIITTTVQFFETLFSNRPSKCRKLHNIAESAVIFDEVQSLPKEIIKPTLDMLKNIHSLLKVSFLFCTATMPAFQKREKFDGIEKIAQLIGDPDPIFKKTVRVKYNLLMNLQEMNFNQLFDEVAKIKSSVLIVMNIKKEVCDFFQIVRNNKKNWADIYHLSTAMVPVHRKEIISRITSDLKNNKKILVCSTQLIEAGVDLDFPVVFREIAPLESLIQSAGRCNREGKLPDKGIVNIFKIENSNMPDKTYGACSGHIEGMILDDLSRIYKYDFFHEYYTQILGLFVDPDKYKINPAREGFKFQTVNDAYRIINKPGQLVFIKDYNDCSKELYQRILHKPYLNRDDYRNIQQYSVQLYPYQMQKNMDNITVTELKIRIWLGKYDMDTGINLLLSETDGVLIV